MPVFCLIFPFFRCSFVGCSAFVGPYLICYLWMGYTLFVCSLCDQRPFIIIVIVFILSYHQLNLHCAHTPLHVHIHACKKAKRKKEQQNYTYYAIMCLCLHILFIWECLRVWVWVRQCFCDHFSIQFLNKQFVLFICAQTT